jgi:Ser/Thr protein kinase RdoA (MazF antagonist)
MDFDKRKYICESYGLDVSSTFSILNNGENLTYLIDSNKGKFIIRRYRINRYTYDEILAEINWLLTLQKHLLLPSVIPNKKDELITTLTIDEKLTHYFVVFKFIEGSEILQPSSSDYEKLGSLMLTLHEKSCQVLKETTNDWIGHKRPLFNEHLTIQESLQRLVIAPFLSNSEKDQCMKLADTIQELIYSNKLGEKQFVHGDMHFGNILEAKKDWYLLDFDECGFGYKEFDIAVPRIHLLAANQLKEKWLSFISGYKTSMSESAVRIGTAIRLFYMAGKIPMRTDMEHIRKQPSEFVNRYLRYINEEISGDTKG